MRGGNSFRDVHKNSQAQSARNRRESALRLSPYGEILAAVFAFEEERGRVEIPFQHANEFGAVAE